MDQDGTVLPDGQHQLLVYKCEDANRLRDVALYLNLPYSSRQVSSTIVSPSGQFQRNTRESVTVSLHLCSTKLTQNANLLSLLKWKSHPERIADTLNLVTRLRGEELVKFLQDVLDSLFAMFCTDDGSATQHSGLVFQVLVNILSLLDDSKFEHFKPVVDAYIMNHFSAALAYKGLLSCVQQCCDKIEMTDKYDAIQKCFRTFDILFKFVIESRQLYVRATEDGDNEDDFRRFVHGLFATFNHVVSLTSEINSTTQVVLLQHIYPVVEQLSIVMAVPETAKLLASLMDSITKDCQPQVATGAMELVLVVVKSFLFTESAARAVLLPTAARSLRLNLAQRTDLPLCTETLGYMMNCYRAMSC